MSSERSQLRVIRNDKKIYSYIDNFSIKTKILGFEISLNKLKLADFFQICIKTPKNIVPDTSKELKSLMAEADQDAEKNGFFAGRGWYVYGKFNNYYCHNFTVTE